MCGVPLPPVYLKHQEKGCRAGAHWVWWVVFLRILALFFTACSQAAVSNFEWFGWCLLRAVSVCLVRIHWLPWIYIFSSFVKYRKFKAISCFKQVLCPSVFLDPYLAHVGWLDSILEILKILSLLFPSLSNFYFSAPIFFILFLCYYILCFTISWLCVVVHGVLQWLSVFEVSSVSLSGVWSFGFDTWRLVISFWMGPVFSWEHGS